MIYLNDKEINESREIFKDQYLFYQEKIEEIKQKKHIPRGQDKYKFIDPRPQRFVQDGTKERKKYFSIPSHSSFMGVGWTWCETSFINTKGDREYRPTDIMFNEFRILNPADNSEAELIFYFLYVSQTAKHVMKLENLEEDAKKKNIEDKDEGAVKFFIMNENSPISEKITGSEDAIRSLASAWFISNANDLSIELLKRKLFKAIETGEKDKSGRGYSAFISEALDISSIEDKVNIQKAIENGLIEYIDSKWVYKGINKIICVVPVNLHKNPHKALINYFNINKKVKDEFDILLESNYQPANKEKAKKGNNIPDKYKDITRDELKGYHIGSLRTIAKEFNGKFNRETKKPVFLEFIYEKLNI